MRHRRHAHGGHDTDYNAWSHAYWARHPTPNIAPTGHRRHSVPVLQCRDGRGHDVRRTNQPRALGSPEFSRPCKCSPLPSSNPRSPATPQFQTLRDAVCQHHEMICAFGGPTFRAAFSNSASQRSKCRASIGSGRCLTIGWPVHQHAHTVILAGWIVGALDPNARDGAGHVREGQSIPAGAWCRKIVRRRAESSIALTECGAPPSR